MKGAVIKMSKRITKNFPITINIYRNDYCSKECEWFSYNNRFDKSYYNCRFFDYWINITEGGIPIRLDSCHKCFDKETPED